MSIRKAMTITIVAALITIGIGAWILWDVIYLDEKPFIIAVCIMFIVVGVIITLSYPTMRAYYGKKKGEDRHEKRNRKKNTYIFLFLYIVLISTIAVGLTMEEKFDISYSVDDEVREYTLYGETYAEYKVSIDIETFDTSNQPNFNKRIQYLYKQVTKGDGYDRHTVLVYEDQTAGPFTVAMVDDGHEWEAGWLITPNEEFYKELFSKDE